MRSLEKRLHQDPDFQRDYEKAVRKYVSEGYASEINDDTSMEGVGFYLPHHGVYKKSDGKKKLRVVFNSAAIYRGRCLNDTLSTGPPLLNQLPSVIIKFREGEIGFIADIEAMFSRIRMKPEDAKYHRFLWRDKDTGERKTFQMNRLSFGDCCSPFIAVYATRTAEEFGKGKPEAVYAIQKKLYMDDYLDSGRNAEEAINRAREVQTILGKGDFNLTKWLSNSGKFNEEFQPDSGENAVT